MRLVAVTLALYFASSTDSPSGWVDLVSKASPAVMLAVFIFGLRQGWWFLGREYRALEERHLRLRDRYDRLIELALQSQEGVQRAATILQEAIRRGGLGS